METGKGLRKRAREEQTQKRAKRTEAQGQGIKGKRESAKRGRAKGDGQKGNGKREMA